MDVLQLLRFNIRTFHPVFSLLQCYFLYLFVLWLFFFLEGDKYIIKIDQNNWKMYVMKMNTCSRNCIIYLGLPIYWPIDHSFIWFISYYIHKITCNISIFYLSSITNKTFLFTYLKVMYTYKYMYGTKRKICTIDAELFWRRRKYFQKNSQKTSSK